MNLLTILMTSGLPEKFPEQIEMPGYFLDIFSSAAGIWLVRVMAVALLITVIGGWKYYGAQSSKVDRQQENEGE